MNMMTYYAITIGPVVDTIAMSSKPLGLWFSSYIFSEFSRRICVKIDSEDGTIILPHFKKEEHQDITSAVGMFPDRIIFKSEKDFNAIKTDIEHVRCEFANNVFANNALADYFYFHLLEMKLFDIDSFNSSLDSMELNAPYMDGKLVQEMRALVTENNEVKETSLYKELTTSLAKINLLKKEEDDIRDLQEICKNSDDKNNKLKSQKYYAIIQADGDRVGTLLKNLVEEEITDFSSKLFEYSNDLTDILSRYGGSLIYAGGDDLLALVPVYQKDGKSLLTLCDEINKKFQGKLASNSVSISFGISIFYYKYPLYEAFKQAQYQLFGVAKGEKDKNCIALRVQKHSGQSISLIIKNKSASDSNNNYDKLFELISTGKTSQQKTLSSKEKLENNSIMYHLMNNRFFFIYAIVEDILDSKPEILKNAFKNYFNHITQTEGEIQEKIEYIQSLIETLIDIGKETNKFDVTNKESVRKFAEKMYDDVINILRYRKFLEEKGDD